MDFMKRGWLVVKRRWPIIVGCVVLGLAGVVAYDVAVGKEYTATSTVFLRAPEVKTSASAYQGNLFTVQRANTYVNMIQSDDLAQMVIDRLALDTTAHDLAKQVTAAPVKETVLIGILVTDGSRQQAANIANTYASEFAAYVARVEAVSLTPDAPPLVTMIKPAAAEDATTNMWALWILLSIAAGVGLLIGILWTWLAERFDPTIRSRQQVEEVTDSRVIGSVPRVAALRGSASVDEVFKTSEEFRDAARVLSINAEHCLREVSKVNGTSVLAVASVNDRDGKSVVARALARAFSEQGHRVGLLQVDPRNTSSDARKDVRNDFIHMKSITLNGSQDEHVVGAAIDELANGSDLIIIDPDKSGTDAEVRIVAKLSDAALVVVRPGHTDQNSLADLVNALTMLETPVIGVATNQAKETNTAARYYA